MAFAQLEPFGCDAEDDRWRQLYNIEFCVNAKAGASPPNWLDRDPEETIRQREEETLESKIETFFSGMIAQAIDPEDMEFVIDLITNEIVMVPRQPEPIEFVEGVEPLPSAK